MNRHWETPPWQSSYEENNYGELFYSLMLIFKPKKVIELGTKAGYSTYHMARGLKDNNKGSLDCYDLWEKYKFNSVPQSVAQENLKEFKSIIRFNLQDAVGVDKLYKKVDILHVDLNNEGTILEATIPQWIDKVNQLIIIEGGSLERDKFEWMLKYKKKPIKKWLEVFARKSGNIKYFTVEPFPSVTIIRKLT